jgi:ParB/RepB/Spo0J family partition protein
MEPIKDRTVAEGTWVEQGLIDLPDYARPHQPEGIDSLAQDMAKNGQLQNIVLMKVGDRYLVVVGVGRILAARKLGWEKIRADVKDGLSKSEQLLMTLAENNEREDASPFYTAKLYKMVMEADNLDQGALAEKVGKDRTLITKYLSLADAPPELQQSVNQFTLGLSHCLEIMKAGSIDEQTKLAKDCHKKKLTVKALRTRIQKSKADAGDAAPAEVPAFAFKWKAKEILIKPRNFKPMEEHPEQYLSGLSQALKTFLEAPAEDIPQVAPQEVVPEVPASETAAVAA